MTKWLIGNNRRYRCLLLYLFCNKSHYENVPFEIPESWCWCKLSDVCNFESGYAFSSDDYKDKGTPLVRISNIQDGLVSLDNCVYIEGDIDKRFIINNGDLLIAMSGATTGKMGVYQYDCPALLNQRVGNIKVNTSLLLQKYRDYFMQSQGDLILKLSYGGAQPNVSAKIISDLFIPIPSLNEQEKIVAEIEKWFGFIDEIENGKIELESHIKKTKSKILDLAISGKLVPQDPNDEPAIELLKRINPDFKPCDNSHYENLPQGWVKLRLGDVCSFERGITFPSSAKCTIKQPGMIACIRTANVQDNLELDDLWYVGNEYIKGNTEKLVRKNDIIMSSANSRELVGKVSYVHDLTEQMTFGGFVLNIRANECILHFFLFLILRTLYLKGYYLTIATQTTNIANLNTKILGNIEVLLPPLTEQVRIINTVNKILARIDNITAEL